ncbi:hypothetical protein BC833DRAFT_585697 [Globomyces pollinis-pini]|nr:hypothetical protein BC833DRAFT_585697 [Globomyces pollinis-pini]
MGNFNSRQTAATESQSMVENSNQGSAMDVDSPINSDVPQNQTSPELKDSIENHSNTSSQSSSSQTVQETSTLNTETLNSVQPQVTSVEEAFVDQEINSERISIPGLNTSNLRRYSLDSLSSSRNELRGINLTSENNTVLPRRTPVWTHNQQLSEVTEDTPRRFIQANFRTPSGRMATPSLNYPGQVGLSAAEVNTNSIFQASLRNQNRRLSFPLLNQPQNVPIDEPIHAEPSNPPPTFITPNVPTTRNEVNSVDPIIPTQTRNNSGTTSNLESNQTAAGEVPNERRRLGTPVIFIGVQIQRPDGSSNDVADDAIRENIIQELMSRPDSLRRILNRQPGQTVNFSFGGPSSNRDPTNTVSSNNTESTVQQQFRSPRAPSSTQPENPSVVDGTNRDNASIDNTSRFVRRFRERRITDTLPNRAVDFRADHTTSGLGDRLPSLRRFRPPHSTATDTSDSRNPTTRPNASDSLFTATDSGTPRSTATRFRFHQNATDSLSSTASGTGHPRTSTIRFRFPPNTTEPLSGTNSDTSNSESNVNSDMNTFINSMVESLPLTPSFRDLMDGVTNNMNNPMNNPTDSGEDIPQPPLEDASRNTGIGSQILPLLMDHLRQAVNGGQPLNADLDATDGSQYESLLRLAELLGPARPLNADRRDVEEQIPVLEFTSTPNAPSTDTDTSPSTTPNAVTKISDLLGTTNEKCTICLDAYEEGESLRVLPCQHGFHKSCLDNWLVSYRNSCPVCRSSCVTRTEREPDPNAPPVQPRTHRNPVPVVFIMMRNRHRPPPSS